MAYRTALIVGKGDKEQHIYFDAEAQAAIRAYLQARNDALGRPWARVRGMCDVSRRTSVQTWRSQSVPETVP